MRGMGTGGRLAGAEILPLANLNLQASQAGCHDGLAKEGMEKKTGFQIF